MRKWYVFDEADCFGGFDSVKEAGELAARLVEQGSEGMHIAYMTYEEMMQYSTDGLFPFSG